MPQWPRRQRRPTCRHVPPPGAPARAHRPRPHPAHSRRPHRRRHQSPIGRPRRARHRTYSMRPLPRGLPRQSQRTLARTRAARAAPARGRGDRSMTVRARARSSQAHRGRGRSRVGRRTPNRPVRSRQRSPTVAEGAEGEAAVQARLRLAAMTSGRRRRPVASPWADRGARRGSAERWTRKPCRPTSRGQ
jgi:hypothetical protein